MGVENGDGRGRRARWLVAADATGGDNERAGITTGAADKDRRGGRGRAGWTRKGEADEDGRGGRGWGGNRVAQQAADEDSRPTAATRGRRQSRQRLGKSRDRGCIEEGTMG